MQMLAAAGLESLASGAATAASEGAIGGVAEGVASGGLAEGLGGDILGGGLGEALTSDVGAIGESGMGWTSLLESGEGAAEPQESGWSKLMGQMVKQGQQKGDERKRRNRAFFEQLMSQARGSVSAMPDFGGFRTGHTSLNDLWNIYA